MKILPVQPITKENGVNTFLLWLVRFRILAGLWVAGSSAVVAFLGKEQQTTCLLLFMIGIMVASPPYAVNPLGESPKPPVVEEGVDVKKE